MVFSLPGHSIDAAPPLFDAMLDFHAIYWSSVTSDGLNLFLAP